jgi:hypothetical protein
MRYLRHSSDWASDCSTDADTQSLAAHATASQKFIDEIRQELYVLLEFASDQPANEDQVNRLMESFEGLQTPFSLDSHVQALSEVRGCLAS